MNTKFRYNDKLNAISTYFGISKAAGKYVYHRRRRGYPYKKDTDVSFLKWSTKLLNALIKADRLALFDWDTLEFTNDINLMLARGIDVDKQSNRFCVNKAKHTTNHRQFNIDTTNVSTYDGDGDGGGWSVVTTSRKQMFNKHILRKMGFIKSRNLYK
jgi:hypothetical protein